MSIVIPFLAFLLAGAFAAYHRLRLAYWAAITASLLVACWLLGADPTATLVAALVVLAIAVPLLIPAIRKPLITPPHWAPCAARCRRCRRPSASRWKPARWASRATCSPATRTGTSSWPIPSQFTAEEQAFLDGPVEELSKVLINDWEITHVHADLPPELWDCSRRTSSSA